MTGRPVAPKHLSDEARGLWRGIVAASDMDEPGMLLLNSVFESFDRMRQAQALIAAEGIVIAEVTAAGHAKQRVHPAVGVERDAKASMMRAWKLLGFDQAAPGLGR